LDKPVAQGGLALDRFVASAILAAFMVACVLVAGRDSGQSAAGSFSKA